MYYFRRALLSVIAFHNSAFCLYVGTMRCGATPSSSSLGTAQLQPKNRWPPSNYHFKPIHLTWFPWSSQETNAWLRQNFGTISAMPKRWCTSIHLCFFGVASFCFESSSCRRAFISTWASALITMRSCDARTLIVGFAGPHGISSCHDQFSLKRVCDQHVSRPFEFASC